MADDVTDKEIHQGGRVASVFKDQAAIVKAELPEVSKEEWEKTRKTLSNVSSALPESVLVGGGTALRLHLEARGYKVPHMPMMDIDIGLAQDMYDRVRMAMTVPGDTSFKSATDPLEPARVATLNALFRRKAIEPGAEGTAPQNFIEHPDKDMALEDKVTKMHVDVFPADTSKMDVSMLTIDNQVVKALSPEALFIMRVQQLAQIMREQSDKEVIEVPQKILQYLFLNSSIVDDEKLKKVLAAQGIELDPVTYAHELNERLREGINSGTIALVDKYH